MTAAQLCSSWSCLDNSERELFKILVSRCSIAGLGLDYAQASGHSTVGSDEIVVNLTAQQQLDGFTTAHIRSRMHARLSPTGAIMFEAGINADTGTAVTFKMSGNELEDNANRITIYLQK